MNVFNRGTPHPTPPKSVPNDFAPRRRSPVSRWNKRVKRNSDKQFVMIAALKASGVRQLGTVRLLVLEGSVELFGEVDSYYLKQLAQESIRQTAMGLRIVNQIRVT